MVDPKYDRIEISLHGGTSHKTSGCECLALRLIDAETGKCLREILPPSTHVLTTVSAPLEDLKGREIQLELADGNTTSSFAWIGVQRVMLTRRERHE